MKPVFVISDAETRARRSATAPRDSVWVSANAGAGKTTLLRDRVIRMLLEGVAPDRILCLTYTKAAAAEMQDRIFGELARWVGLAEAELSDVIRDLTGGLAPAHLRRARALFAEAVETPGGLKIQTIHAFAERLLHLFPIEAGVPVDFSVLDDLEGAALRDEARRTVLVDAAARPDTRLGRAFATILKSTKIDAFDSVTREAMSVLRRLEARGGLLTDEALDAAIEEQFGISPDVSETALEDRFLASLPPPAEALAIGEAILALGPGPQTVTTAEKLIAYGRAEGRAALFEAAYNINIDSKGTYAVGRTIDRVTLKAMPQLLTLPDQLKEALEVFLESRAQLRSARSSQALNIFANAMLKVFSRLKAERRVLDFEDMIILLRRMLADGQAAWVMMKLDAAIEHVLVDEAQDTTPEMWGIVGELTADFFSGEGQVSRPRSLFVVGDEKQSIYSFQGAEPRIFDAMRREFAGKIGKDTLVDKPVRLHSSFRSSQDVLDAVDQVFAHDERRAGLSADDDKPGHSAAQPELPGLVECWPLEEHLLTSDDSPSSPSYRFASLAMRMAQRIASTIHDWLERGETSAGKPIGPGDILILAQKRGPFFNALLRALGERKIPVAGADRLKIQHEIGVQDLIAIASAALLPGDDLTLATALKTPIFGLDDTALEPLCRGRKASLRGELARVATGDMKLAAIEARLRQLEERAHLLSPFDFLSTLLVEDCPGRVGVPGRAAILKRLGADASDAIDAFLGDALEFGRRHPPSLALFIAAEAGQEREIKRDLDSGQGRVRVMTVHAAKGLEARVVFVADAMSTKHSSTDPKVHPAILRAGGMLLWAGRSADAAEPIRQAGAQAKALAFEEYRRLLYVGLTRARERLYIVGHWIGRKRGVKNPPGTLPDKPIREWPWHALVTQAMRESERVIEVPSDEDGRLPTLRWPPSRVAKALAGDERIGQEIPRPHLLFQPLAAEMVPGAIRPSQAMAFSAGQRPPPAYARAASRQRGVVLHRLFQLLPKHPPAERLRLAQGLVREAFPLLRDHEIEALITPVLAALVGPEFSAFIAEGSRAEVGMAGPVRLVSGLVRDVSGRLDRVCVSGRQVDILDFKTGIRPASGPSPDILGQMALYRALARDVFGRPDVRCHLYWTASQTLESLADAELDVSFAAITSP